MSNSNGTSPNGKAFYANTEQKEEQPQPPTASVNGGDWFKFHRDFIRSGLMTRTEAGLFCDLLHFADRCFANGWLREGGWFACSEDYLTKSCCWEPTSQKRLLASLQAKRYLNHKTERGGRYGGQIRYIRLRLERLDTELQKWREKTSGTNVPLPTKTSGTNVPLPTKTSGTNVPEGRGTNVPDIRETNKRDKPRETNTLSRPRGSAARGGTAREGFLGDMEHPTPEPHVSSFARTCTVLLYNALMEQNLVNHSDNQETRKKNWTKEFDTLRKHYPESEIKEILDWYIKNIRGDFVPECFCAESFRKKFVRLKEARAKQARPAKPQLRPGQHEGC